MGGEADQVVWRGVRPVEGIRGIWPARNATRINKNASKFGIGTVLIYTVPAGKKLFISSSWMSIRLSVNVSCSASMGVNDDEAVHKYFMFYFMFDLAGQQADARNYTPALEAEPGDDVKMYNDNAGLDSRCGIHGWLEDA